MAKKNMKRTIKLGDSGKRLDKVVTELLPDVSRSQIQKMIKEGVVTVNKKNVSPHHFLKEGDVIEIAKEKKKAAVIAFKEQFRVIHELPEYLVIDKPAGLVVHPGVRQTHDTLVDQLLERYPEIRNAGSDPIRPGIVHRLDKDASGVMVIARTNDAFESLQKQFKLRQVKKRYNILTYGHVTPEQGVIDLPLSRSKQLYTKRAAGPDAGRPAITRYSVERFINNFSLVRVEPETGRTHQIRVHFFARGYPVVGDPVYFSKKTKKVPATRLMLHACFLGFRDLAGEWHEYSVPPGEDFQKIVVMVENS